jgi:hypothetical protein
MPATNGTPVVGRSVLQEKRDDAQHHQGYYRFTPCHLYGLMVHRLYASRSFDTKAIDHGLFWVHGP